MATTGGPAPPAWFSPGRLLMLFCGMSLLVYVDRGVISSNGVNGAIGTATVSGSGIQGDFGLTLFEDGVLPAAFMVGLLGASLVFAEASKTVNGFRLIGVGLSVWTVAVVGCGLALGFWSLVLCRAAVGVGEASFVALASTFIDDNAPPERKTAWLATFYLCIPVGYALGYIFGGLVGQALGWRAAFWLEAALMAPFALFCLLAPAVDIKSPSTGKPAGSRTQHKDSDELPVSTALASTEDGGPGDVVGQADEDRHEEGPAVAAKVVSLVDDLAILFRHPVYVVTIGATAVYTGVLGAYAYMGPKAGRDIFSLAPEKADLIFGVMTVITGVFGTVAGGVALDRVGSSIPNACRLCAGCVALGGVFCALSFAAARGLPQFTPLFVLGQMNLFAIQAPANAIVLWSVPPALRPLACSVQVVVTHLLGDVPSPPLLGLLQGWLKNWRLSMGIISMLLLASTVLYQLASQLAHRQPDYRVQRHDLPPAVVAASGVSAASSVDDDDAEAQLLGDDTSPLRRGSHVNLVAGS
mmetsp:Transcript_10894/g.32645  ORF Transcript_10894/g.32645 Transcript_10894/m.32645 type:complete len:526 (-) Transcript_10894:2458-4035(-)|eukprot:CAMPEP_0206141286 /NCGR_PEP_ID=MMETSP1473-20131121/12417_1 /ASSEMBLY_ACC=CAM_ASM_001109 /TAXON_ID=1461547 /ORGANISM="Stichococcus sp, Strain RCC1054" /LENGTH=525 /DNA_ID=CAMNT_0053535791 /DNA_START=145 /DNA_END=1722 /DNA_ORIENTATION=-